MVTRLQSTQLERLTQLSTLPISVFLPSCLPPVPLPFTPSTQVPLLILPLILPQEYQRVMSTNLDSTYHLTQLCHPMLKAAAAAAGSGTACTADDGGSTQPSGACVLFNSSVAGGPTAMWSV